MALRSTGLGGKVDGNQEASYLSLDVFRQAASQPPFPIREVERELLSDDPAVNAVMFMHLSCPFICHQPPFQAGHPIGWKGHTGLGKGEAQVETHSLRLWGLPGHTDPR